MDEQKNESQVVEMNPETGTMPEATPPVGNAMPLRAPVHALRYPPRRPRHPGEKRDLIFALVFLILSCLAANFFLMAGCGIGLSVAAICLFLTGIAYLRPYECHFSGYSVVLIVLYILCAVSFVFSDEPSGAFCATISMIILAALTIMELRQLRSQEAGSIWAISDWCVVAFVYSFGSFANTFYALFHGKNDEGMPRKRRVGSVFLGIACALPVLLIVVPLLTSSDAAFHNLLNLLTFDSIGEIVITVTFGIGLFLLLFGQHFTLRHAQREPKRKAERAGKFDPAMVTAFLSAISVIYVLYLVSQLAYFFSAFAGLLPKDYTVAEYARRGFFEMLLVCLINLGIVAAVLLTVRRKEGKEPLASRLFSLFFCVFSLLLIVVGIAKMFLYIDSFGMTHLRIITSVFMIFLAVVFCTLALRLFFRRLPYMKVAIVTAVLLVAIVGFADLDRVVAKYNVEAYLSGKLDSVDMDEFSMLQSDSIVEYIWKLRDDPNYEISDRVYEILTEKLQEHDLAQWDEEYWELEVTDASYDWRGYNISDYKAFCFLKEHAQQILDGYYRTN